MRLFGLDKSFSGRLTTNVLWFATHFEFVRAGIDLSWGVWSWSPGTLRGGSIAREFESL